MNISKKVQNNLKEVDKNLKELDNIMQLIIQNKSKSTYHKSKISHISKHIENIYSICIKSNDSIENIGFSDELDYFIEKNIFRTLVDYCCYKIIEIVIVILPVIDRLLTNIDDELFLMNSNIISSLRVLVIALVALIKSFSSVPQIAKNDSSDKIKLIEIIANFNYTLINKVIKYPNFYFSISLAFDTGKFIDSDIFYLVTELISLEYTISKREIITKIRKSLLYCFELENFFHEISIKDIDYLLKGLIQNLISSYNNFKMFDILFPNEHVKEILKKEKISIQEYESIVKTDVKSILKFYSMVIYCFSENLFKEAIASQFFDLFLIQVMKKDLQNGINLKKVLEYYYYITKYITNKEISSKSFYFIFGISNDDNENEFQIINQENDDENDKSLSDDLNNFHSNLGVPQLKSIKLKNSEDSKKNYQNNSSPFKTPRIREFNKNIFSENNNLQSDDYRSVSLTEEMRNNNKLNHEYEEIISIFMKIIDSNNSELKILLYNILNNLIVNCPNLFIQEVVLPYIKEVLFQINKDNSQLILQLSIDRKYSDIMEIIKEITPENFLLNFEKWGNYFDISIDKIFQNIIGNINNSSLPRLNNINFEEINEIKENNLKIKGKLPEIVYNKESEFNEKNLKFNNKKFNLFHKIIDKFTSILKNKYKENLFLTKLYITILNLSLSVNIKEKLNFLYNIMFNLDSNTPFYFLSINSQICKILDAINNEIKVKNYEPAILGKWIFDRFREKSLINELENNSKSLKIIKQNENDIEKFEFIDNLILFSEFYKDIISHICLNSKYDPYLRFYNDLIEY